MALALMAGLATSTAGHAQQQSSPARAIVATTKPVHSLVAQVMEGVGPTGIVVDGAASPHTYAMRPSDARLLARATIVFRMSEAVEPFTAKAVKALPKAVEVVTLAEAPGVKRLKRRTGATFETDKHASHGHGHGASKVGNEDADGHVWLDPANAKAMIAHIAARLSARDPANAAAYRANADKAAAALDSLSADLARDLEPVARLPYIVFHDALQYLEARYGLTAVGSITTNPDVPPSGKRLAELRKKVQGLSAVCVFAEPNFETRVVQSIIEGTSARTGSLDPEGTQIAAGPEFYGNLMRKIAAGMRSCLLPST